MKALRGNVNAYYEKSLEEEEEREMRHYELKVEERLTNVNNIYMFICKLFEKEWCWQQHWEVTYELEKDELHSWAHHSSGIGYPFIIDQHPTLTDVWETKEEMYGDVTRANATFKFEAFCGMFAGLVAW